MLSAVSFWLALLEGSHCDGSVVRLAEFRAWLGVISVTVFFVAFLALAICEALSRGNRKRTIAFAFGGSFTNAASGFFTAFGHTCDGDPDGDGLPTGMERSLGTDPFAADTDGDGALLVLNPPHLQATGSVIWYPTLTVTPGSWRPYIESAAETFTAMVTDIPPGTDVSYEWSASDTSSVTISSPHARSTLISCNAPTALGWGGASLSVRASFAGEHLVSRLAFDYGSRSSGIDWSVRDGALRER